MSGSERALLSLAAGATRGISNRLIIQSSSSKSALFLAAPASANILRSQGGGAVWSIVWTLDNTWLMETACCALMG